MIGDISLLINNDISFFNLRILLLWILSVT